MATERVRSCSRCWLCLIYCGFRLIVVCVATLFVVVALMVVALIVVLSSAAVNIIYPYVMFRRGLKIYRRNIKIFFNPKSRIKKTNEIRSAEKSVR